MNFFYVELRDELIEIITKMLILEMYLRIVDAFKNIYCKVTVIIEFDK